MKKLMALFLFLNSFLFSNEWTKGQYCFTANFYPYAVQENSNLIFSPLSLQLALAMASEIAYGKTQEEMLKITSLPKEERIRRNVALEFLNKSESKFLLANSAWVSAEIPTKSSDVLLQYYKMEIHSADFQKAPQQMCQQINSWVEEKTQNKIQNLLPDNAISQQTVLVLVNILYMLAPWASPFNPDMTYQAPFLDQTVSYMRKEGKFGFLEEEDQLIVELPFKESLSLTVVMPKNSLEDLEKKLTGKRLNHWLNDLPFTQLDLSLPKFKIESTIIAKEILSNMGMKRAFSVTDAEFELGNIFISDIVHKAVFEIDELGGTGAAATGIVMNLKCYLDKKKVVIDRPFLVFVSDKENGLILFAGKVIAP